jgi:hypothetical protein
MTAPDPFTIKLTPEEQALVESIEFDILKCDGPDEAVENGRRVTALTRMLLARDAVPEYRRRFFTDPAFNVGGRGSSRKQQFERNGCRGEAIPQHPHFLPYLHYFIFGADLPDRVRLAFREAVEDCGLVTSSDVVPLGHKARRLARGLGLRPYEAREEFFKLSLDCGVDVGAAASIRDSAGKP